MMNSNFMSASSVSFLRATLVLLTFSASWPHPSAMLLPCGKIRTGCICLCREIPDLLMAIPQLTRRDDHAFPNLGPLVWYRFVANHTRPHHRYLPLHLT